jgi:hypothetical protein
VVFNLIALNSALLTLYNHAAFFTAIADGSAVCCSNSFKVSSFDFIGCKAFRAAVIPKFFFSYAQMAVPAAESVVFDWHQP